jgi:hypothetical protein
MFVARSAKWSLRLETAEFSRLAWAFAISLAFHLLLFGGYFAGHKLAAWQNLHWPAWLRPVQALVEAFKKKENLGLTVQPRETPLVFVEVNPAQATPEPPKDASYYSSRNSKAANPQPDQDTGVPKITGNQTQIAKTEDVPREKFTPLQPSRPVPQPQASQEELKAKPTQAPGDLTTGKPDPTPKTDDGQQTRSRPRTIKEALARAQSNRIPGEKMKQDGGVKRHQEIASLDTRATPFGAYDEALIQAISQHWYSLLDQRSYASDSRGKVVLQFRLHYDGRITDMTVAENTAGEVLGLICQKAVLDPSPFATWPGDMRRLLGDTRNIQFTFYYN